MRLGAVPDGTREVFCGLPGTYVPGFPVPPPWGCFSGDSANNETDGELSGDAEVGTETWELRTELLASCCKTAGVGHGYAQVLVGIDWRVVDADFVVEVRTGAAAAEADVA